MIVGVMASGEKKFSKDYVDLANTVGGAIADQGFHLLTGGGGGLMEAVGLAFLREKEELLKANKRVGSLISIIRAKQLPELDEQKRHWEANKDNKLGEIVIRTHLPFSGENGRDTLSRNHINALSSDLVVVLPGGSGTFSEMQLAWEYEKHIMVYLGTHGKVGGKSSADLRNVFLGEQVRIGNSKVELERWLREKRSAD
jgi:predicted Rossmann-fold nucleotide-binding protein